MIGFWPQAPSIGLGQLSAHDNCLLLLRSAGQNSQPAKNGSLQRDPMATNQEAGGSNPSGRTNSLCYINELALSCPPTVGVSQEVVGILWGFSSQAFSAAAIRFASSGSE